MKIEKFQKIEEGNKNFKDYRIYSQFLKNKFFLYDATVYKLDNNNIYADLDFKHRVITDKILRLLFNTFYDSEILIRHYKEKNIVEISYISIDVLNNIGTEINMNKYNI
jgi:hypothetical protein